MPAAITELVFQNAGVATLEGGYTTVGQAFQPGDLMPGQTLLAQIGGASVPVQVDVRTTHPDGSVKMAALTLARPTLEPWQEVTAELVAGGTAPAVAPVSLPGVLAGHNATLKLAIEDGRPPLSIDIDAAVSQAVAQGTASFWQKGPLATQARVEIPVADSSMRVVLDVTAYKDGEIRFTVGLNNDRAMEATGGRLSYVATVTLDGETLFNQGISQGQYQRVSLDFASSDKHGIQGLGAPHEGWLNIKHDTDYLISTNAVFPYNTEFTAEPATLRAYYDQVANNPLWGEVLWNHNVTTYMGTAGARPDIGYTTAPNANWLLSQDAAAASYALGQAKVAGYVPWNLYDMANGEVLNTDNYPRLWTDVRGGIGTPGNSNSGGLTQQGSSDTGWAADRAHQPDLSFVPYLLTGERWIYDNLMSQASHSIMGVAPSARQTDAGIVLQDSQLRGAAWSMRQIDHAAWAAVDGSAEQDYFTRKVADNWNWLLSKAPEWTETWGELAGFLPTTGDRVQLWQMGLVASVTALSAARGSEEAREALDFMADFLLGMVNSAADGLAPQNAAVTSIPIRVDGTPIDSWAELAQALTNEGRYAESDFSNTIPEYQKIAVSALAMAYHATGEARFREAVENFLALQPPGTSMWAYANQPQFGLTIPASHDAYRGDARYPDGEFAPLTILRGSGPDEIRLSISQDYFNGSAQYRVLVDGKDLTGVLTASGLKSRADADTLIIRGDFGSTVTVRVQMLNDAWGGSTDKDRNLYVNALSYNGEDLPTRAYLANNTARDFVFTADGTLISPAPVTAPPPPSIAPIVADPLPPKTVELGSGPDQVVIKLSQDWYLDSAQYTVTVNGTQIGGLQTASAFRSAGQTDTLIVRGNFADGPGTISIRFTNDKTDGYGRDRNLHVESATLRGEQITNGTGITLYATADTAKLTFDLPDLTPKTVVVGSGAGEVVFKISQKYWLGKAQYAVLVNGQEYGERQFVSALESKGEYDTVIVRGPFATGTKIGLKLVNDNPLSGNTGRDIFIHEASAGGQTLAVDRSSLIINSHVASVQLGIYGTAPPYTPPSDGGSTGGTGGNNGGSTGGTGGTGGGTTDGGTGGGTTDGGSTGGTGGSTGGEVPQGPDPGQPALVAFGTDSATALAGMVTTVAGISATYTVSEPGMRGVAALTYGVDGVEVEVTSAWNTIRAIAVTDSDGGTITVSNAVEVAISAPGPGDATITVHNVKRGIITTGAGDDSIVVNAFSNAPGLLNNDNTFLISSGAGDDTIDVSGWGTWTAARIDAGSGNDAITGTAGADHITGGTGNDVMAGGAGRDWFIFRRGDGHDTITDFNPDRLSGDIIQFVGLTKADLSCLVSAEGTLLSYGESDSIWLPGVQATLDWPVVRIIEGDQIA